MAFAWFDFTQVNEARKSQLRSQHEMESKAINPEGHMVLGNTFYQLGSEGENNEFQPICTFAVQPVANQIEEADFWHRQAQILRKAVVVKLHRRNEPKKLYDPFWSPQSTKNRLEFGLQLIFNNVGKPGIDPDILFPPKLVFSGSVLSMDTMQNNWKISIIKFCTVCITNL